MEKINVYVIGSCTAEDILNANVKDKVRNFNVNRFIGSVNRSFAQPGKIAKKILEDKEFNLYISQLPNAIKCEVERQINLITKQETATTLLEKAPKNSVFIVDCAYEMSPFYYDNYEMFDLYTYNYTQKHYPAWLREAIEKYTYTFDSGIKEFAFQSISNYKKYLAMIEEKNIACIIMDNTMVRNVYDPRTNEVGQIIPLYNQTFYRVFTGSTKEDPLQIFDYNQKMVDNSYKFLFDMAKGRFPIFKIPRDKVFCDLNHPLGYHPSHYHITCRKMLYQPLKQLIISTHINHLKKIKKPIIHS